MDTKALRQKILDLAIRGKLVPQAPNDEPASVLLERIRAQKQQMVKDGKLKAKDIKDDTIIFVGEDNLHYEKFADGSIKCIEDQIIVSVPSSWAWVKMSTIAFVTKLAGFEYTKNVAPNLVSEGVPLFKGKNIQNGEIIYEFESFIPLEVSNELSRSQITKKCLLTPYVGTIGNIGIHDKNGVYHLGSNVGKIELYNDTETLLEEYVLAYLRSQFGNKQLTKHMKATAQASISIEAIRDVYIPIPPAKEQKRICTEIEIALGFINNVETEKENISHLIDITKSKILDLAIRGKLVPQDPSDEPASVLLERIRAEKEALIKAGKIKRDKKESIIFKGGDNSYYEKVDEAIRNIDDELPFDLPEGWVYVRLCDLLEYEQPTKYIVESTNYNNNYQTPVLTAGKSFIIGYTKEITGIREKLPVIIFDDFTTESKYVTFPFKVKSSAMKLLNPVCDEVNLLYIFYAMQCVECDHYNHQRYWISDFSQKIIALPPILEQHRILEAILNIDCKIKKVINSMN